MAKDKIITVRMSEDERKRIEAWKDRQLGSPSLGEAIRILVELALNDYEGRSGRTITLTPDEYEKWLKLRERVRANNDGDAIHALEVIAGDDDAPERPAPAPDKPKKKGTTLRSIIGL
jgi:hypothetical protein